MWNKSAYKEMHLGVIGTPSQTGTGTDDLSVIRKFAPAFAPSRSYQVVIDSTSETFKWSNDGGSTFEESGIVIEANKEYSLINADGEEEGIAIIFASATGHVNGDLWNFTTTGDVVSDSAVAFGAGVVSGIHASDALILRGQYVKGDEDGVQLYLAPMATTVTTIEDRVARPIEIGDGGLRFQPEYFELTASANFQYRVNLKGINNFKVYQVRKGSTTATGLITCYALIYRDLH